MLQGQAKGPVLLVVDSIGAFYHIDRAKSDMPAANRPPGGYAAPQGAPVRTTNTCGYQGPFPPEPLTLQAVHTALLEGLHRLRLAIPMVFLLTCRVVVGDNGLAREFLPPAWKVRAIYPGIGLLRELGFDPGIWVIAFLGLQLPFSFSCCRCCETASTC